MGIKKGLITAFAWLIAPLYFTKQFFYFFGSDVFQSLKYNFREEYVESFKLLSKKTKRVHRNEITWLEREELNQKIKNKD